MPYNRPGVYVEELSLPNVVAYGARVAVGAFIGVSDRGPTTPVQVESWNAFVNRFGGFGTSELHHALFHFFGNGGRTTYVTRVVGAGAVASTLNVAGSYGAGASTAGTIMTISAASPGVWGDGLSVTVTALANRTGAFSITVTYGGNIVETWNNLSMNQNDPRYVETIVNSITGGSTYIAANVNPTVEASLQTAANNVNFALVTSQSLAAGANGAAPDATAWSNAVAAQAANEGPFLLNLAGISDSTIINNAIAFAAGRKDVFLIIDADAASSQAGTVGTIPSYTQSSFAAVYWPRLIMQDPASTGGEATRVSSPSGAVMGQYIATDAARGVFKTPAGTANVIGGAIGMEYRPTDTEYGTLNDQNINAFKRIPGTGIVPFGGRTLKRNTIDQQIAARRSLIFLGNAARSASQFAAFEPNDSILWNTLQGVNRKIVDDFWRAGGLKGRTPDQAYYVICDESNNTPATIDAGQVIVDIGVAIQKAAEFVIIRIGVWSGGSGSTSETGI